jgi:hypothetical protein
MRRDSGPRHHRTMTTTDRLGHPLTTGHPSSAERYDQAVAALLRFGNGVAEAWDATVVDDPGFALGQIGRAYLRCLSSERLDAADAGKILDELGARDGLTDRERRHLAAARAYAAGDLHGAREELALLSVSYPRDALALAVGHQLDFFCGDALTLRDRVGRVLLAWDAADPDYGFVLGMYAFGLEECGLYPQAEETGLAALGNDARDVWALHAVIHTHEMRGQYEAGRRVLDERRKDWTDGNFFVVHNAWHEALFCLESGDIERVLAIYDTVLHHNDSAKVALEMLDASALLWRLHLAGIDTGGRWEALASAWDEKRDEPWYMFNDMHAVMAFVGAGRLVDARDVVDRLRAYAAGGPLPAVANHAMTAEVGLPVCSALVAFGEERYGDAVRTLHPIRAIVHRFGGSHAQRDAVARTLLESALRAGDLDLARALASERLAVKESPYNRRQLTRLEAPR